MSAPPSARACGSCSLCCKILRVDELKKPMGVWCGHFRAGRGCGVYEARPPSCRNYECLWLISPTMPDSVRPDRSKVVMSLDDGGRRIIARADPAHPDAWRREPVHGQLRRWAADSWFKGRTVWAMVGVRMWLIAPDRDVDIGETDERSQIRYAEDPDGTITVTILHPLAEGEAGEPPPLRTVTSPGRPGLRQ